MRSHQQIIDDAGGYRSVATTLAAESVHTVRSWRQRNSIPREAWPEFIRHDLASLIELAGFDPGALEQGAANSAQVA